MKKMFAVGETVYCYSGRFWGVVIREESGTPDWQAYFRVEGKDAHGGLTGGVYAWYDLSRDPHAEIPPKPKKMVTKEAHACQWISHYISHCSEIGNPLAFHVPANAQNIHCTYEVPEGE